MTNDNGSTPEGARFSRRQVFQYSGIAAAAVGGASLLEALRVRLGGGGGGGGTGGILVHGATGGSAKDTLDAHRPVQNADIARCFQLYEPLLYWDHDYEVQSAVAESVTPSADAKTWTIKLRQGVTFHNGKDVTPEDVLFTLQRVAGKEPTSAGVALAPIIDFNAHQEGRRLDGRHQAQDAVRRAASTSSPSTPSASSRPTTTRRTRSAPARSSTSRSAPARTASS